MLVIAESTVEAARIERALILQYRERGDNLTNSTDGGEFLSGLQLTPEVLAKRVESQRRFYTTPEGQVERELKREIGRKAKAKQIYSDETREKMRQAKLGKPHQHSAETRAKMSASQKGVMRGPMSEEHRLAHKMALTSPETRAKMSAAAKNRRRVAEIAREQKENPRSEESS